MKRDKERLDNAKEVEAWIKNGKLPEGSTSREILNMDSTTVWQRQQQIWCPKKNWSGRDIKLTQPDVYLKVVVEARDFYHTVRGQLAWLYADWAETSAHLDGRLAKKYEEMLKLLPAFPDKKYAQALIKYDDRQGGIMEEYSKGMSYTWKYV